MNATKRLSRPLFCGASIPLLFGVSLLAYVFTYAQPSIWIAIAVGWIGLSLVFTGIYIQSSTIREYSDKNSREPEHNNNQDNHALPAQQMPNRSKPA